MAKTVFILGAGASKNAGAPLMSDFLEVAENLLLTGKVSEAKDSFEAVLRAQAELPSVHSKSELQIRNVEDVFSAFEMANTLKKLGEYKPEEIENLVRAMKTVIVNTIEETVAFPLDAQYNIGAPTEYAQFVELLTTLQKKTNPPLDVAVITFNYDMALDYAFFKTNIVPYYGLDDNVHPRSIPLHKLHGSLNWGKCSQCDTIFPIHLGEYTNPMGQIQSARGKSDDTVCLPIGSTIKSKMHKRDGAPALPEPVVIPPTWNKSDYYKGIATVWSYAAQELGSAENIFIIGYSLPDSDSFFRYLYALGTASKKILKRIWVFNPDESVQERFKKLIGPGARQSFDYPLPAEKSTFLGAQILIRQLLVEKWSYAQAKRHAINYTPSWLTT